MELLYISSAPSQKEFDRIKGQVKKGAMVTTYGMNESGFKFHKLITEGMLHNPNNRILYMVGRGVNRGHYNGFFWKKRVEKQENIKYHHLAFLNFPGLKHVGLCLSYFFHTLAWQIQNRKKEKGIVMDASYITVIPFVLAASRFFKCKRTAVFCDIYEYMADVKDARANERVSLIKRLARKVAKHSYQQLDSFVFLTEEMNDVVNPTGKPYIVMEGLVDVKMKTVPNDLISKAEGKVVMYAGALREAYGIKTLVEGFSDWSDPEGRLWIYGDGDYVPQIKQAAEADSRIMYMGKAPLDHVVKEELRASVLINPRPVDREFTKYSFPSKNMEYMVSGTPILTTRLPGMPQDYYEHIYTIDGNGKEHVTEALKRVFAHTREELHQKGQGARQFVLEKKNNIEQAKRICDLLVENI